MELHTLLAAAVIGVFVGFLGGLLGKGGSAIATPLLHAVGVPAIVAVAAPLPATVPSTLAASWVYWKQHYLQPRIVRTCILWGIPATIAGALATRWISGGFLVQLTDVVLVGIGLRLLINHQRNSSSGGAAPAEGTGLDDLGGVGISPTPDGAVAVATRPVVATPVTIEPNLRVLAVVAIIVGISGGLLANSGGFLLAPLLITVVKLPIRSALAASLATSAVLAVPGTIVHAALGHIDWTLVGVFAATSIPLSMFGARVALRIDADRLEQVYGAALVLLGAGFLIVR
ncbi:MAG: sulfite exporter TauE/SafE family protein [Ilumatobacteraceae bacterium]